MEFNKAYNRQEFMQFLQNSFLPEDFKPKLEPVIFRTQMKYSSEAVKLGTSETLDLVFYEIKHTSQHDARVALSKEAFRILADEMQDRALVVFVPKDNCDNYRFSFIEITLDIAEDSSRVTRNYSNPRRYSYYLGEGIAYHTPNKYLNDKGRVVDDEDLHSRFSVEVLTKEFYNELSDWYAWAIQIIRFPNDINDDTDDAKYNNESAIRLITRLIFVWFLKQRHLIPDQFFDEQYIANNLIAGFNPHKTEGLFKEKSLESKYYKAILQNLFFAMLNSPITLESSAELSERHFRNGRGDYDNNKLMRYEYYFSNPQMFVDLANSTVPFLNGGLFDCLDDKDNGIYYDGFSDRESIRNSLILPDYLFFGEEMGKNIDLSKWYGDKKKKKVSARGIIDILKRYNFTVEENTPFDQEVSLDPELLGKVFENLLASYNPETQTTARKQTGSFYTPREIVQYMVDESLVAHLKRTVGEELEPKFRELLQYTDEPIDFTDEQRKSIMQSLYNCKILDPACGSGAFPMGMLQQMVHILGRIDPDNEQWKEMMMNQAIDETSEAYRNASKEERSELIADIERSFDESVNRPDYARKLYLIENCIYGVDIQPIAIQISKLRFFISLVVDQKTNAYPTDNFGIRPLPNLEAKFVVANTLIGITSDLSLADQSKSVQTLKQQLKIARHKIFSAKTVRTKRKYKQQVNDLRIAISRELESLGFIDETETDQLASWDMFDQNAFSSFFDSDWMFGVKDGFDIVIGNPPYKIVKKSNTEKSELGIYQKFESADFKINLYALFYEKAIRLSIREGFVSFIVPDTILNLPAFLNLRKILISKGSIFSITLYEEKVFENATVGKSVIVSFYRYIGKKNFLFRHYSNDNVYLDKYLSVDNIIKDSQYKLIDASDNYEVSLIMDYIRNKSIPLSKLCNIYDGINPGSKYIKSQLFSFDYIDNTSKPVIDGKDFDYYSSIKWSGLYVYYNEKHIQLIREQLASQGIIFTARIIKKECFFPKVKIVTRQTADRIIGTLDKNGFYTKNSVHSTLLKDEFKDILTLEFILSVLNSKLMNWLYTIESNEGGRVFPQVKIDRLRNLPFKIPNVNQLVKMSGLVKHIFTCDLFERNVFLDKIDLEVYKLYNLSYDNVLVIDPDTKITKEEYENQSNL